MDLLSDSGSDVDHQPRSDGSDTDAQLLAEQALSSLKDDYQSTARERDTLRAQLENAVGITKKMNDIHTKNVKLAGHARELQAANEDLAQRLEIAVRTRDEISGQLFSEKQSAAQHQAHDQAAKDREVAQVKRQCKSRIEKVEAALKKADEEQAKYGLKLRQQDNAIGYLLQSARQFFGKDFTTLESLTEVLSKPQIPVVAVQVAKTVNHAEAERDELKQKVKKQTAQLKSARKQVEERDAEIRRIQREYAEADKKRVNEAKKADLERTERAEEMSEKSAETAEMVKLLSSKNDKLTTELKNAMARMKEMEEQRKTAAIGQPKQVDMSRAVPAVKKPDVTRELNTKIENLTDALATTTEKLKVVTAKRDELMGKVATCEKSVYQLQIEFSKKTNELGALQSVHKETLNEVACLRESLHAKENVEPERQEVRMSKRLKAQVAHLEHTVRSQTQQIRDVHLELEQEKQKSEHIESKVLRLRSALNESVQKHEYITGELAEARAKLHEKPTVTIEDLMPTSSWLCHDEFNGEISQQIEKVAGNGLLQPASKLAQIYKVIGKHFNKGLNERDDKVKQANDEIEHMRSIVGQLVIDMSLVLSISAVNFDELVHKGGDQKVLDAVKTVVSKLDDAQRRNYQFAALGEYMQSHFGEASDLFAQVAEVKDTLDERLAALKAVSRKSHDLKTKLRELKATSSQTIEELTNENNDLQTAVSELREETSTSSEALRKYKRDLANAKRELKDLAVASSDAQIEATREHETASEAFKNETDALQAELNDHIECLTSRLEEATAVISEHDCIIEKMKKAAQAYQKVIREKDDELREVREQHEIVMTKLQQQHSREKDDLVDTYDRAVDDLKMQCDAHRGDLERLAGELAEAKKMHSRAKKVIVGLKREKLKLENEMSSMTDRMKRDQLVNHANIKQATLAAETSSTQKIEDAKARFEGDKRRLFSFAADEFRTFFSATEALDERSFKALISKVRGELRRLAESDGVIRRMVGASPRQSTNDAVAQILMA